MSISKYRANINKAMERFRHAQLQMRAERQAVADGENLLFDTEEAHAIIKNVAQGVQETAHSSIAGVVSRCLETVFDEPYEFKIVFEQKRGRTEARLVFVRDGESVEPLNASGGGVVDVAAFALRLACLVLARPVRRRVVVLDEPFKFVSAQYQERVRIMLEELASELAVQFIMVTHIEELRAGKIIVVE